MWVCATRLGLFADDVVDTLWEALDQVQGRCWQTAKDAGAVERNFVYM